MPRLPDLINGFRLLKKVDLNAVRVQAEKPLYVMVVGEAGSGKTALVKQLADGPGEGEPPGFSSITMHRPDPALQIPDDALVLLLIDARKTDHENERALFGRLVGRKIATVVCYNQPGYAAEGMVKPGRSEWPGAETAMITVSDRDTLMRELVPAILRVCNGREVRLGRYVPMLRTAVAQKLIDDACLINATYSLTTGLAEIVPVLDLPLNLADMVILTKNQALMAYEITLAMGMQAEWRHTIPKLGAVVGSAFLWRQLARYLAGLVPVIGIVPKIVVSYSGTYVVGEAVYQWCARGEKLNPEELRALYAEALRRASVVARALIEKSDAAQIQAADKFREIAQFISAGGALAQEHASGGFQSAASFIAFTGQDAHRRVVSFTGGLFGSANACRGCGRKAPRGAVYCAFCGKPLAC